MKIKFYPKNSEEGYSADEIRKNIHWLYADIECHHCFKLQPVAATGYVGGPCVRCGNLTSDVVKNVEVL